MAQLKKTAVVTTGSAAVSMPGDVSAQVRHGFIFMVDGELVPYTVAADSTFDGTNTNFTLTGNYAGTSNAAASGVVATDYTYPDNIPTIAQGDVGTAAVFTAAMYRLQAMLGSATLGGLAANAGYAVQVAADRVVVVADTATVVATAATVATNAATASTAATSAAASAASLTAALASFRSKYLGAFTADPALDGNGNALTEGVEYYNSTTNKMRLYHSGAWVDYDATAQTAITNAALSAAAAAASQAAAATSATGAATSQGTATTAAGTATTQAGIATTQAGAAATQAGTATTQAGIATTQAGTATTQATNAATTYTTFDKRFLGAKAANPTLDNVGAALQVGALYINTGTGEMRWYNGTAWIAAYLPAASYVDLNTAQTLTNKTLTAPVINAPTGIVKADVGLGNVDNTSDVNKPISNAEVAALALKAPLASPTFTGTVGGVTAAMVGLGNVTNTSDAAKPVSTAQQTALNLLAPLASPAFTGTPTGITKTHIGLPNVDNTADTAKPVSTAQQTALDLKANSASPTLTGTVNMNGSTRRPANAVAALNLDCSTGNVFTKTIAGNSTFTVNNVPAAGTVYSMMLELTHTSGTITWFSGVIWPGGTAPSLTTGKVHLFYFVTRDAGTTWRATALANYAS